VPEVEEVTPVVPVLDVMTLPAGLPYPFEAGAEEELPPELKPPPVDAGVNCWEGVNVEGEEEDC
jgi:hypothetical protein